MESLEKRLSDYKLIKSKIKETQNGYSISEDINHKVYIEVNLEKLYSDDGKEYFAIQNSLHPIGILNNFIYSDIEKAMNGCYKQILKEALTHMHVSLGLVLKGTDFDQSSPLFEYAIGNKEKYYYKYKRELKKNKKKSKIEEQVFSKGGEVQGTFFSEKGIVKKIFNYFSSKREKSSGANVQS